jgi:uncharacterized protein
MKFLLVIAVLVVAWLVWRSGRASAEREAKPPKKAGPPPGPPHEMVSCPVCSVHLPRGDAVAGSDGRLYCSQEHRRLGGP